MEGKNGIPGWHDLLKKFIEDPQQKQRIAREIRVNPITLTRWANNEARPREGNMLQLLRSIPFSYRDQFMQASIVDFPGLQQKLAMTKDDPQEIPPEFYSRVLSACAYTPESLCPQGIYDLILQQAINQLDPERSGLLISIVSAIPPHSGNRIRSLCEITGIGTSPWKRDLERKTIFLGAESLTGAAVMSCRTLTVQSREEQQTLHPAHWADYEQSAVACPIAHRTKMMGGLVVASAHPHYFTDSRISLVEQYANLLALAFLPENFYEVSAFALHIMPEYREQEPYFRNFARRIAAHFADAAAVPHLITFYEAQMLVLQEIEAELLNLPPD